ncbi:MAG: hypothetical protein EXR99_03355 [Gemmataceae bacterium]|nr:hypothetical protein [Gemmataceae bacterium]
MKNYPPTLRWIGPSDPVPILLLNEQSCPGRKKAGLDSPPWVHTGTPGIPFDFTRHMRDLIEDIAIEVGDFTHLDPSKLLVGITRARNPVRHGLQARVTPMRFQDGKRRTQKGRTAYEVQRFFVEGSEILYLVTFCLPRFLNQTLESKLVTIIHELFHISPEFNGDLRRHSGRCQWHSHSKKEYDLQMLGIAREYLGKTHRPARHDFLRLDYAQLVHKHGGVRGLSVPLPRLLPVTTLEQNPK